MQLQTFISVDFRDNEQFQAVNGKGTLLTSLHLTKKETNRRTIKQHHN